MTYLSFFALLFFFNDTATTEIYTLSLHDALPIFVERRLDLAGRVLGEARPQEPRVDVAQHLAHFQDRKSTRLNSSHSSISYAVFCLKKKKKTKRTLNIQSTRDHQRASLPQYHHTS